MKNGWRECQLGDVIELKRGYDLPERERRVGNVPIVSSSGISGTHDSGMAKGPGVVTGRYGTLGEVFLIRQDFWPLNTTLYVRDFKGNDPQFISYFLRTLDFLAYSDKAAVPGLNRNHLHQAKVFCPPVEAQIRIAEILGSLDDKIELNQRTNETLEAMARTLFRSWFVDFDPVRAKADGQTPRGMDAATVKLFPDSFDPSALGPIPKGWRVGKLEEVAEIVMGSSPAGDTYNEVGIGTPLVNGPVEFGEHFAVKRKWTTEPGRLSKPNDLIFCVRGSTTGRRVVADDVYCLGRGVCSIRSKSGAWAFIHRLIDFSLDRLLSRVSGSVFPNLNGPDLKQFEVVIPNDKIVAVFEQHAQSWMNLIAARVRESENLAATRDAMLPKLMSGEA